MKSYLKKLSISLSVLGLKKESQDVAKLDDISEKYSEEFKNFTSSNIKTMGIQDQTALVKKILKEADYNFLSNYMEVQRIISCIADCLDSSFNKASVHLFLANPSIKSNQELDRKKVIKSSLIKASITYNENLIKVAKVIQIYFPQFGGRLLQSYNNMILAGRSGSDIDASTGLPISSGVTKSNLSDDKEVDMELDSTSKKLEDLLSSL
jgi:hypothetical protein